MACVFFPHLAWAGRKTGSFVSRERDAGKLNGEVDESSAERPYWFGHALAKLPDPLLVVAPLRAEWVLGSRDRLVKSEFIAPEPISASAEMGFFMSRF
jgi:hypothetical protein